MSSIEWILTVCGGLAVVGLGALVGIGWKSRETLVSLGTEFVGFKDEVRREFGHVREDIQRVVPVEARMTALEISANTFREAYADYQPWRKEVDLRSADHERRIGLLEHDKGRE